MKKYFIHIGTDQAGPFSAEELRERKISADTPVWYEGAPAWTKAGDIEELKPMFAADARALPRQGSGQAARQPGVPKQKSTAPYIIIIAVLLVCIAAMGGWVYSLKQQLIPPHVITGPYDNTVPRPVLVAKSCDNEKSDLWKMRYTVHAMVRNEGAKGKVVVGFHVYQNGTGFARVQVVEMAAGEEKKFDEIFTEVRRMRGEVTFDVDVKAK